MKYDSELRFLGRAGIGCCLRDLNYWREVPRHADEQMTTSRFWRAGGFGADQWSDLYGRSGEAASGGDCLARRANCCHWNDGRNSQD